MGRHFSRRMVTPGLAVLAVGAAGISGCATVTHGTTQKIAVNSQPCGARVIVDGSQELTTPCSVPLSRKADHRIAIELEGYERQEFAISRVPTGKTINNIWVGGLIGWAVDGATGADNKLVPEQIDARLSKLEGTVARAPRPEPGITASPGWVIPPSHGRVLVATR